MARDSASRRAWVKNTIIIFLVIMLLLTFFSNTILSYTLPEVSAQYAQYGNITNAIKVDGTVKANESYKVVYEADQAEAADGTVQSRKVVSVYVKAGDTVEKDAPILSLKGGSSDQLEAAQKEYDELKKTYDLALFGDNVSSLNSAKTIKDAETTLENAKKSLASLREEYNALKNGVDTTSILQARVDSINDELEEIKEVQASVTESKTEITAKRDAAKALIEEDYFSTLTIAEKLAIAESDFAVAESNYNTLKAKVDEHKARLDKIKGSSSDIDKANELTKTINDLKNQIDKLELERSRYIEDYKNSNSGGDAAYKKLEDAVKNAQNALKEAEANMPSDAQIESNTRTYNETKLTYDAIVNYNNQEETLYDLTETKNNTTYELNTNGTKLSVINETISKLESNSSLTDIEQERLDNARQEKERLTALIEQEEATLSELNDSIVEARAEKERLYTIANKYAESAYSSIKSIGTTSEAKAVLDSVEKSYSDIISRSDAYTNAKLDYDNAQKALDSYTPSSDSTTTIDETTYRRKLEDYDSQLSDLEVQLRDAQDKLDIIGLPEVDDVIDYAKDYDLADAQEKYDAANTEFTDVSKTYEESKTKVESLRKQSTASSNVAEYDTLIESYDLQLKSIESDLKQKNKELEKAQKELSSASDKADRTPETVSEEIEKAEDSVSSLEFQLAITKATETQTGKTAEYERADQKKKLDELAQKIEKYKTAPENTDVTAPIAGRIVSVEFVPGDTVTSGNTVANIEIADKGYICEISMASEEARKIQVGAECSLVNSWWYSNITATVSQIRSDPQSQGKKRIVVIDVKGDVYEGQSLKFSIGDRSQSYDSVLPNSAIREDKDGKFVLVVNSKKTPLGVRYTAVRTNIEVLASDDTKSAVSGLFGSEFVITNSTSPISDKQQVRLADSTN